MHGWQVERPQPAQRVDSDCFSSVCAGTRVDCTFFRGADRGCRQARADSSAAAACDQHFVGFDDK